MRVGEVRGPTYTLTPTFLPRGAVVAISTSTFRFFKNKDLTDTTYEKWQISTYSHQKGRRQYWNAVCKCGRAGKVCSSDLFRGGSKGCKSCGPVTHGETKNLQRSHEYSALKRILSRCLNPNNPDYKNHYGGKGIKVCDRWQGRQGFANFLADMGRAPSSKHGVDRYPNQKGNYEPGNVRWALQREQVRNYSRNINISYQGRTQCITDWATELGVPHGPFKWRVKKWGSVEKAIAVPFLGRRMVNQTRKNNKNTNS